jgi:hypothetical protein
MNTTNYKTSLIAKDNAPDRRMTVRITTGEITSVSIPDATVRTMHTVFGQLRFREMLNEVALDVEPEEGFSRSVLIRMRLKQLLREHINAVSLNGCTQVSTLKLKTTPAPGP